MDEKIENSLSREITHIVKHEREQKPVVSCLNKAVSIATIISLIAIPLMIAYFGLIIQDRLSERATSQKYVELAVSILTKQQTDKNKDSNLRNWAVSLLNENSPIKFSTTLESGLIDGKIIWPTSTDSLLVPLERAPITYDEGLTKINDLIKVGDYKKALFVTEELYKTFLEYFGENHKLMDSIVTLMTLLRTVNVSNEQDDPSGSNHE